MRLNGIMVCAAVQGFAMVYCGEECTAKVSKLVAGTRYTFKLKV